MAIGTTTTSRCSALLQVAELADPFEPVAGRQLDLLGDALLRLEHGAAEVAAAHENLIGT